MLDLSDNKIKTLFCSFMKEKMLEQHLTPQALAHSSGISERTIYRYVAFDLPKSAISQTTFFTLLDSLQTNAAEFSDFVEKQANKENSSNINATSGPTININTGNTINNSPIGTQGNVVFNFGKSEEFED